MRKPLLISALFLSSFSSLLAQQDDTIQLKNTTLRVEIIAQDLRLPWDMVWGPDGNIWFNERGGIIYRLNPDTKELNEIFRVPEVFEGPDNSGSHAFALHPQFPAVPFAYIHYTYGAFGSRFVKYTYDIVNETLRSRKVLIDDIPGNESHNGSRIAFDEDGFLYFSMGDAYSPSFSQKTTGYNGKILRMTDDGKIPADNPFPEEYTWSYGHRNPQGLCFGRNGILYSSEHGAETDDEVNIIEPGRNYGWPNVEGFCDFVSEKDDCESLNVKEPIIAYTPTEAPCGLAFFDHESIPEWKHSLILAFLKEKKIEILPLTDDGSDLKDGNHWSYIEKKIGRVRDVLVSPTGRVFVCTSNLETKPWVEPLPEGHIYDLIIELVNDNYEYPSFVPEFSLGESEIFPNPVEGSFFINLETTENELTYRLLNLDGNEVHTDELVSAFQGIWQINLPDNVSDGMYVIEYRTQETPVVSAKIVIQRN